MYIPGYDSALCILPWNLGDTSFMEKVVLQKTENSVGNNRIKGYKIRSKCPPHFPTCPCLLQQVLKYFSQHLNVGEVNDLWDFDLQFYELIIHLSLKRLLS